MLFTSFSYIVFLPCVCLLYYLLPHRFRWVLLLAASYFFYGCWSAKYALLMLLSTAITFASGALMDWANRWKSAPRIKKWLVALSFGANLAILFLFKYYGFFLDSVQVLMDRLELALHLPDFSPVLPVGISFYTFQALSYTMDVYRGKIACQRHFGKYALFVSFFPQLVAGPIERSANLLPQFDETHTPDTEEIRDGLMLIVLGMFQKLVIADRLAKLVDLVYNDVGSYGGMAYVIATLFFTFQIYCDFGGYSNIAIGSARLLGFRLMRNFHHPYLARSIQEFWRRWHISLSTWFKDYLYIPLGGSRVSKARWAFNTMVVFLVSGLWHGAAWTFVIWGGLHGAYQLAGRFGAPIRAKARAVLHVRENSPAHVFFSTLLTFSLVAFAWGFFRVNSFADMVTILSRLHTGWNLDSLRELADAVTRQEFILSFALIAALYALDWAAEQWDLWAALKRRCLPVRWVTYYTALLAIILFGVYGQTGTFIYFQF